MSETETAIFKKDTDLFGHPKALTFLFSTEMWERFSYYGMRALLTLYLVNYLLLPGHVEGVIGLASLKSGLEGIFGPLEAQPFSSLIYGTYTALVYLTPIAGGLLADSVLGQRRTVIIGAVLMAIGHFLMAFEGLFLFALFALILGNGAFKPNISTQVGSLYEPGDVRRDRAYSIFYVGINSGAFLGSTIAGPLGEEVGWHYGFASAGVGMVIGLVIYLWAYRYLPPDERTRTKTNPIPHKLLTSDEWRTIGCLFILFLPNTLFWATYEQQGNTIALWAESYTDRAINLFGWHTHIPITWFQSFNPLMILVFTPLLIGLWGRQKKRNNEPSSVLKMAIGCFGVALSNLVMVLAAWQAGASGQASWLWLVVYFAIITTGELYLSPTGLALISKVAPVKVLSLLMGVWLATSFVGNFMAGWLGSYWIGMDKSHFFLMIAGVAFAAGVSILALQRHLRHILHL